MTPEELEDIRIRNEEIDADTIASLQQQLAASQAENERLKVSNRRQAEVIIEDRQDYIADYAKLTGERDALRQQVAELQRDAERLKKWCSIASQGIPAKRLYEISNEVTEWMGRQDAARDSQ